MLRLSLVRHAHFGGGSPSQAPFRKAAEKVTIGAGSSSGRIALRNAVEKREPLLIYEMGGHQTLPFPLWLIGLPIGLLFVFLMAFIKSALVRPLTFQQVFFTYVIPLIPIFYAWGAHTSLSWTYRIEDLDALLEGLENSAYSWEKGFGRSRKGGKLGSYLLGTTN